MTSSLSSCQEFLVEGPIVGPIKRTSYDAKRNSGLGVISSSWSTSLTFLRPSFELRDYLQKIFSGASYPTH